jgi:putative endonuclease
VTSNLLTPIDQHRRGVLPGFTSEYGIRLLMWFERQSFPALASSP